MQNSFVYLRNIETTDLPKLYEFNLDPDANRLAGTIPRSADDFATMWENTLADKNVVAKAIIAGDRLAGSLVCFNRNSLLEVGYWLGREFWGFGIASKALKSHLNEFQFRPLYASVATSNQASLRVLKKCDFVIEQIQMSPATDRYLACEVAVLVLKSR